MTLPGLGSGFTLDGEPAATDAGEASRPAFGLAAPAVSGSATTTDRDAETEAEPDIEPAWSTTPATTMSGRPATPAKPGSSMSSLAAATGGISASAAAASWAPLPAAPEAPVPPDPTVVGGTDHAVFACPSCGRTIARGSLRCDACGQRLLLDVAWRRALVLAGAGAIAGFMIGGILVGLTLPRAAAPAAVAVVASPTPGIVSASPVPSIRVGFEIPVAAAAALRGTTGINGRLVAPADDLTRILAAKTFVAANVQPILRQMSVDARAGAGMVPALAGWSDAANQQAKLAAFYDALTRRIDTALASSTRNAGSYKTAAKAILKALHQVPGLDAAARTLASSSDIDLPVVVIPASVR